MISVYRFVSISSYIKGRISKKQILRKEIFYIYHIMIIVQECASYLHARGSGEKRAKIKKVAGRLL